jgi:hypothetical protein
MCLTCQEIIAKYQTDGVIDIRYTDAELNLVEILASLLDQLELEVVKNTDEYGNESFSVVRK